MHCLLPYLLAAGSLLAATVSCASAEDNTSDSRDTLDDHLVVMTWNLEWFYDEHAEDNFSDLAREQSAPSRQAWDWRRDAIADSIAKAKPDIVAMQEVENQRVLFYLARAIERRHQMKYSVAFAEGTDYFTEQDVGFLYGPDVDLVRLSRYQPTRSMRDTERFSSVSKHVEAVFEVPVENSVEQVTVMTMHLRARSQAAAIRTRQARSVHAWLADRIAAGEDVIVLGDTNSESTAYPAEEGSDMAALSGFDTPSADDNLIDLGRELPVGERQTHLLDGRQYDRILVSPSLTDDDPQRGDLVFESLERPRELAVRGDGVDTPEEHWDRYWEMPEDQRDLSDHWPLVARFSVK